ncbi:hypothetical protein CBL_12986 [Carabus blaptoides fortunei]
MEREDGKRNSPRKELYSSSSEDDEDVPLRKRFRINSASEENSTQGDSDIYSDQNTQETILTGGSEDTAEVWEPGTETSDQQDHCMESLVSDDNNTSFPATDQNTQELQTDTNANITDDTDINSAVNLESTTQPETRYVIPQSLLYRPSISNFNMKQNTSNSVNETDDKHEKPKMTNDMSANIEQIRQDFVRSWDRILAANDLIPETELAILNSSTPDKICEYLHELATTNARNENLRDLVPRVCNEIYNLQHRDERVNDFPLFETEPQPIPIDDFSTDPSDSVEPDHRQAMTSEQFAFDTDHWDRIQQAFIIPEQLSDFNELLANTGVLIPNRTEDGSRDDYQPMTDVPNELAHIYNTIIRDTAGNGLGPCLTNFVSSDSNTIQPNNSDLFRSLLGIPSPFEQNVNTHNEEITTPVFHNTSPVYILNRPEETERVPTQIFSNPLEVVEFDFNIPPIDGTSVDFDTIRVELEINTNEIITNPTEMETKSSETLTNTTVMKTIPAKIETTSDGINTRHAEIDTTPHNTETNTPEIDTTFDDVEINPADVESNSVQMETNPTVSDVNSAELNTSSVELASNPVAFDSNSNQENSDASTLSGFDAYEGFGEFVVVPSKNNFKPMHIMVLNSNGAPVNVHNVPAEESITDEVANSAQEVTNHDEENNDVQSANLNAIEEMNQLYTAPHSIETAISVIMDEANRFEQQATRFEETAREFPEVEGFFREISGIFEYAAISLEEAIDNFESTSIEVAADFVNELDPPVEGIAIEDVNDPDQVVPDNDPDQVVPDIEHDSS